MVLFVSKYSDELFQLLINLLDLSSLHYLSSFDNKAATRDLYFKILDEAFTNHIFVENTYFTYHIE